MDRFSKRFTSLALGALAFGLLAGCEEPLVRAPSLTVRDREFEQVWVALMETVDENYPLAVVDSAEGRLVSEWVPPTGPDPDARSSPTLRRRIVAHQRAENGDVAVQLNVQIQQLRPPRGLVFTGLPADTHDRTVPGFRGRPYAPHAPSMAFQWQDAGSDAEEARRLLGKLRLKLDQMETPQNGKRGGS